MFKYYEKKVLFLKQKNERNKQLTNQAKKKRLKAIAQKQLCTQLYDNNDNP